MSRPDISFAVNKLSQFLQEPTNTQWVACKRVLRYIKGTPNYGLIFRKKDRFILEGYSDADWASDTDDRRSVSGNCMFLGGNLIQWSAKKQKVVSLSSTEAEYRSLSQAATEVVWLQQLFVELGIEITNKPVLWCDNLSAGALASNPVFHARTKHIEIDVHFIRDLIAEKKLSVQYVPTDFQVADILTNPLSCAKFQQFRESMKVQSQIVDSS